MIYQFQIFRAVYEEGGFSKGSKRLGLTQSAVSQQIKSLEENLKTPLFNENDRSTPSLAGEFLYRESGKILAGIEDIKNGISNLKNIIRGKITFGMIDVAAISLLPKTLKLFKNKFPEVQMEAKVKPSGELMQMVDNYQLDFCISVIHNLMSDHEFNVIYKDSIVAVVEKNSPIAKKKEVCIDDLKGEPLILYPSASYSRKLIEEHFRRNGVIPTIAMEMHYPAAIISLVAQGMGIGLISELSAKQEKLHNLICIPVKELVASRQVGLIYKSTRLMTPQSRALIEMIKNKDNKKIT